jgi:hypothetical protein
MSSDPSFGSKPERQNYYGKEAKNNAPGVTHESEIWLESRGCLLSQFDWESIGCIKLRTTLKMHSTCPPVHNKLVPFYAKNYHFPLDTHVISCYPITT